MHIIQINNEKQRKKIKIDRRFKIISPCGSGKTILMINMIDCFIKMESINNFKTLLFLVPTNILISQLIKSIS